MDEQLEERQLVLCTVDKIIGTTVFVKIENNEDGTITTSEIASGRIRNLRDYVVPGKKIVCKILSIKDGKIQLSLRRVKPVEKKELLNKIEKEKSCKAILKTVLGEEEAERAIEKITEECTLLEFFEGIKLNPKLFEKYVNKECSEKILKILESKKEKPKELKKIFRLSSKSSNGIMIVKNILEESCRNIECSISYIAAGKYSLFLTGKDFKKLNNEMIQVLENIEKLAKKNNCEFSVEKS